MEIHFKIIGVLLIALALVHIVFPKYFNWDKELKSLSLINRQSWQKNITWTWFVLDCKTFHSVFWLLD
jgi:hypothetical protein